MFGAKAFFDLLLLKLNVCENMTSFSISLQDCENEIFPNVNHSFELIMDCKFNEKDNLLYTSHVDGKIFKYVFKI